VDLIFLDLNVEDSQGLNTLAHIRAAAPLAAIVVMTGESDEDMALEALRQGAQDYLVKGRLNSTVLRSTARYAIERMRSVLNIHHGDQILGLTLDALPACIALLDGSGVVLLTNSCWNTHPNLNNPLIHGCTVGTNYLAVCDHLTDPEHNVHVVARGILQVLAGIQKTFSLEYVVPNKEQLAWYELNVTRFSTPHEPNVVVSHLDITEKITMKQKLQVND
jgi:hypothetical protein